MRSRMHPVLRIAGLSALLAFAACETSRQPADTRQIQYIGAKLFNGSDFVSGNICVSEAVIVPCVGQGNEVVDLSGLFVTPPFGDAHTHHFDGPFTLDWHMGMYLNSGTYYAMNMTAPSTQVMSVRNDFGGPDRVDVQSSLGGITGPESHPAEIYEAVALRIMSYEDQVTRADEIHRSKLVADDAYYVIESDSDFEDKWPLIMSRRPDFVKVYLRHSDRYQDGYGKWGPGGGIDPALLPLIKEKSAAERLRLAVATSSRADVETAIKHGADIITHLPCVQDTESDPASPYYSQQSEDICLITEDIARAAAEQDAYFVLIASEWRANRAIRNKVWESANITTLLAKGVRTAIGSNAYGSIAIEGMISAVSTGFLPAADILKIATIDTPQLIFPDRALGCLDVGCEASFIAFAENPLDAIHTIRDVKYGVKDGILVADNRTD